MTPLTGLPAETRRRLRELDPAADSLSVSPETSRTIRERIMADPHRIQPGEPDRRLLPVDRHRSSTLTQPRRTPLVLASLVMLLALAGGIGVVLSRSHGSGLPEVGATVETEQSASGLISRTNPLAVGRQVSCEGVSVPVEVLTEPGNAETGSSESSVALRAFLADNPFEGMGSVTGQNWLKLGETDRELVFGQRQGTVGIGPVVTLERSAGAWKPSGLGGCSLVVPGHDEQAALIHAATLHGNHLQLTWMNGSCGGQEPDRVLLRTETMVTPSGLHLLLVTRDNPAAAKGGFCAGVGMISTTSVTLDAQAAALISAGLYDDAVVPAQRVELE